MNILFSVDAKAQESSNTDARRSYDYNIFVGTLLPSKNGLQETVPGWGMRYSFPSSKGIFEVSGFSGIGHGIVYRTAALDFRIDAVIETITSHFLLGFHGDQYEADMPSPIYQRFSGGWHYGGGVTLLVAGPFLFRFDFRHRFSPGQVLEITLGFTYRVSDSGT